LTQWLRSRHDVPPAKGKLFEDVGERAMSEERGIRTAKAFSYPAAVVGFHGGVEQIVADTMGEDLAW
jgi:hypothetical protein